MTASMSAGPSMPHPSGASAGEATTAHDGVPTLQSSSPAPQPPMHRLAALFRGGFASPPTGALARMSASSPPRPTGRHATCFTLAPDTISCLALHASPSLPGCRLSIVRCTHPDASTRRLTVFVFACIAAVTFEMAAAASVGRCARVLRMLDPMSCCTLHIDGDVLCDGRCMCAFCMWVSACCFLPPRITLWRAGPYHCSTASWSGLHTHGPRTAV